MGWFKFEALYRSSINLEECTEYTLNYKGLPKDINIQLVVCWSSKTLECRLNLPKLSLDSTVTNIGPSVH